MPHETNNYKARLLHPLPLLLMGGLILGFQLLIGVTARGLPAVLGYAAVIPPDKVIELTNQERQKQGLNSLTINQELNSAALAKAGDMFAKDYWAHVSPDGVEPWKFITDAGYVYVFAGENLARDFTSPEAVVAAWMASPSHRENLLSPKYQEIGVAVVDGDLAGIPTTLVVQMFGTRVEGQSTTGTVAARTGIPEVNVQMPVVSMVTEQPTPKPSEGAIRQGGRRN